MGRHYFGIPFPLSIATRGLENTDGSLPILTYDLPVNSMQSLIHEAAQALASRLPSV
jgi:hypothetical protein